MKRFWLGAAIAFLLASLASGCTSYRWLSVEFGEYNQVRGTDDISRAAAADIQSLTIDQEAATVSLKVKDGSAITLTYAARSRANWPDGCPTNIHSYRMEVLDVVESNLSIGPMTLYDPVLVRNCPLEPVEIVLREDGQIGGGRNACSQSCLVFTYRPLDVFEP